MYQKCSSEKSALQQRKFEACMLELMCRQSYDTISVSLLCREVGFSRKTFYRLFDSKADRLFDSKADVLYAAIDHIMMDEESYVPDASVGPGNMHKALAFWQDQKLLLDALKNNNISSLVTERAILHIMSEEKDILHSFGANEDGNGRETMLFFVSGLFALILDWHEHGFDRSIDEMSATLMHILMSPPIKNPLNFDP